MDRRYPDAVAIAKKMKDGARANPWVPFGLASQESYHHFPDGLSLCLTVDVLSKEGLEELARRFGLKQFFTDENLHNPPDSRDDSSLLRLCTRGPHGGRLNPPRGFWIGADT